MNNETSLWILTGLLVLLSLGGVVCYLLVGRALFMKKDKECVVFAHKVSQPIDKLTKGKIPMLSLTITNEQKVQVTITPVTATGKPAKLDGAPTWTVANGAATLDVAADGLSAFLISPDVPDISLVNVSADADLGAGVETIADAIQLTTEGAKATSLGLTAAAPVPK